MNRAATGQHPTHRMPVELGDQVDQSGAFGMHRRPGGGQFVDLPANDVVAGQLGGELLGETAGQQQRVRAVGQRVDERVELGHVSAGGAQQLGVFGIAEAERLAGGHGDGGAPPGLPSGRRRDPTAGRRTRLPAAATTAARSTCRATRSVIASTAAAARRPYSTAVTRPRYLVGSSNSAVRGMAPSTGTPTCSQACRSTCSCLADPTRLRITPATLVAVSNVEKPCSSAAMLWLWPRASTTRITGAPSRPATCAVDPAAGDGRGRPDAPVEKAHHTFDHRDVRAARRRGRTAGQ